LKPAALCAGAFVTALAVDLLTKVYAVAYLRGPHGIVFNDRAYDLAIRVDVNTAAIGADGLQHLVELMRCSFDVEVLVLAGA